MVVKFSNESKLRQSNERDEKQKGGGDREKEGKAKEWGECEGFLVTVISQFSFEEWVIVRKG